MQRIVYLSPFTNPGNMYIERQKALWQDIGFDVQPFTLSLLLKPGGLRGILNRRNAIALHWLESRPFLNLQPGSRFQLKGLIAFLGYCCVLLIARARTIQFIHNHHVHDAHPGVRNLSARLTRLLARIVDLRIVHDPAATTRYKAEYLPHPLYREITTPANDSEPHKLSPLFGTLGAIRPYKGVDRLLKIWPRDENLLIAGSANSVIAAELQDIIAQRELQTAVTVDFKFLSPAEFNVYLERIDVMVLPHTSESILVSGAFFEAIGRVPAILARRSSFGEWAQTQIPNIYLFDDETSLFDAISQIKTRWPLQNSLAIHNRVEELFSWKACCAMYTQALAAR
jgi:glycosyltransferase involved in cell wall biosynthesis